MVWRGLGSSGDYTGHVFEDPVSLNAQSLLPELARAGVTAIKIEGRQRSRAYVEAVVKAFRSAVDALGEGRSVDLGRLLALAEGQTSTEGAYVKTWR